MSNFYKKYKHLRIPFIDVQTATDNFADENLITQGGFDKTYKGKLLRSGKLIDIVALLVDNRLFDLEPKWFDREIITLCSLNHQNLVSIVGYCDHHEYDTRGDKDLVIVYKFEAKGSLDQHLSDPTLITWTQRLQICLGIARALSYIHYEPGRDFSVIHRDINSCKILLGDKWEEAKLSGFGLSILQPAAQKDRLVLVDQVCGTPGYMEPAYVVSESVSHKTDVYSFGVVLFEVLTGRKAFIPDNNGVYLAELVKSHYENGQLDDIIHPGLHNQMDSQALKTFSKAAYFCLNNQRAQRPSIDRVIVELEKALKLQLARERLESHVEDTSANNLNLKLKDLEHLKIGFDAIQLATENFAKKYCIGSGTYGAVYKAELELFDSSALKGNNESKLPRRSSTVAIKYIFNRKDKEGEEGFIAEIEALSNCIHPNIVSFLGFCHEPLHMILVYEYVSNGSLEDYLSGEGNMTILTWVQRIQICIDIARGLDYIHATMDNKQMIIHRDIKSANILLTKNWVAKIADFGLSKSQPLNHTASTINATQVAGTKFYIDPEYVMTHKLKKASYIYSFGVVLFEILSGRLAYDPVYTNENENGIAPILKQHFERGMIKEMVDPRLNEECTFTLSKWPNQVSLNTFSVIGYKCLAEKQADRPSMKVVIEELEKALNFQKTHKDSLRISLEDIRLATQNFKKVIHKGEFGEVYKGKLLCANGPTPVAVKRWDNDYRERDKEFLREFETLFEYKHENIIGLVGYCNEYNEKILVYEYASNGSLDKHLDNADLTWTRRLKIAIEVANVCDFLHGGDSVMIHTNINPSSILLNDDWKAKVTNFERSVITPPNTNIVTLCEIEPHTDGYYNKDECECGFLKKDFDIYSLGVVLCEMMCGRLCLIEEPKLSFLTTLVKNHYEEGELDELVFKGIKNQIMPKSLTTYQRIACACLNPMRERPIASEVILQLKKALEFQEDYEIWAAKLPTDYKEIIQTSNIPVKDPNVSNKDLYEMFSKGILLQKGKLLFSVGSNGERNEMVSATMFTFENKYYIISGYLLKIQDLREW